MSKSTPRWVAITGETIGTSSRLDGLGHICGAYMPEFNQLCPGKITSWPFLSKCASVNNRKYYHPECALRLHVVTSIPSWVKRSKHVILTKSGNLETAN